MHDQSNGVTGQHPPHSTTAWSSSLIPARHGFDSLLHRDVDLGKRVHLDGARCRQRELSRLNRTAVVCGERTPLLLAQ
jgi:hypothetical protein